MRKGKFLISLYKPFISRYRAIVPFILSKERINLLSETTGRDPHDPFISVVKLHSTT